MTLNDLANLNFSELGALYEAGTVPADLGVLGKQPNGRLLAVRGRDRGTSAKVVRYIGDPRHSLWIGKRVSITDGGLTGSGTNRVKFGPDIFPYVLVVGPSLLDGKDTIVFDYEHADNNAIGRRLYNELRQVAPGVFLGLVTWKTRRGIRAHLAWFGVEADAAGPR